jgi:hypothetical protein
MMAICDVLQENDAYLYKLWSVSVMPVMYKNLYSDNIQKKVSNQRSHHFQVQSKSFQESYALPINLSNSPSTIRHLDMVAYPDTFPLGGYQELSRVDGQS